MDLVPIVLQGLVALVVLAVVIGLVERRARSQAWTRIADARRLQQERARDLDERERGLRDRFRRPDDPSGS
jgi:Mg2+/citrate symporter